MGACVVVVALNSEARSPPPPSSLHLSRGEYFDLLGDNHRGIVSNFRQPVEKFPNFMKNQLMQC